jgi:hypothetical protein
MVLSLNDLYVIRSDVNQKIGEEILTVYGPSIIDGIFPEGDKEYVHLREFGEEPYKVKIETWEKLLNI